MNVFTDYAETHWVPINGDMVTVQRKDPVLLTPRRLGASLWTGPGVRSAALFAQGG